jgi:hypothetical protein
VRNEGADSDAAADRGFDRFFQRFQVETENDEVEELRGGFHGIDHGLDTVTGLNDQFQRVLQSTTVPPQPCEARLLIQERTVVVVPAKSWPISAVRTRPMNVYIPVTRLALAGVILLILCGVAAAQTTPRADQGGRPAPGR